MPLKVGKRTKAGVDRRKGEAVKVDRDLLLQAEQRAVNPAQGREVVGLWDRNNV